MIGPETGSGLVGPRLGPVDVRYMRACMRIYVRERGCINEISHILWGYFL